MMIGRGIDGIILNFIAEDMFRILHSINLLIHIPKRSIASSVLSHA